MQAPQDALFPYFVIQMLPGTPHYVFGGGAIERTRVQISQYYEWTGQAEQAIIDNAAIVAALDVSQLTGDGIMMQRLTTPGLTIQDNGEVLQVVQDWQFEYQT